MFEKLISRGLIFSIFILGISPVLIAQNREEMTEEQRSARIEKVRNGVTKLGTGEDAKVKVKVFERRNKYRGHVKSANDTEFTIVEKKTGNERTFRYDEVRHVSGKNLAFGTKVMIVVGVGVAALIIVMNIILRDS